MSEAIELAQPAPLPRIVFASERTLKREGLA